MATRVLVLQFIFPPATNNPDPRTFQIVQIVEDPPQTIEMYKFYHPNTGTPMGETSIQRKNLVTQRWENAGHIEWTSHFVGNVYFGLDQINFRELRRPKKATSKSRRFKVDGSEYKWKLAENEADMTCVSSRGKTVATWLDEQKVLRVSDRVEDILDRIVATCFLNVWMKRMNRW